MTTPAAPKLTLCELADAGIPGLESFSPFCLKAHRALRLAGLSYERKHGTHPGAFQKWNPAGQVPVLLVGDEPVADSTAILRRIEAMVPGSMSGDGDARARGEAWLWEELADTSLNGFFIAARWADDRNWPGVRMAYFGGMPGVLRAVLPGRFRAGVIRTLVARDVWRAGPAACWTRFSALLDQLDARAPRQGFWLGAAPTAADVALFAQLHGLRNHLTAWQRDEIARRSALAAYLDRVQERTALPEARAHAA